MSSNAKKSLTATQKRKLLTCHKCKKFVKFDENLQCKRCKNKFDLICANVAVKKFNEMTNFLKAKWTCSVCANKIQLSKSTTSTPITQSRFSTSQENVEVSLIDENKQISPNESIIHDTNSSMVSIRSESIRSLPDLSTRFNKDDMLGLKKRTEILEQKLESAHLEIDNLVLENNKLQRIISEQEAKINNLLRICSTSTPKSHKKGTLNDSKKERKVESEESIQHKTPKNTIVSGSETLPHSINYTVQKENLTLEETEVKYTLENNLNKNKSIDELRQKVLKEQKTSNNNQKNKHVIKNKIVILGDQQCAGTAARMKDLRKSYKNPRNYTILGLAYPNAPSNEIISRFMLRNDDFDEHDWIILRIGANDNNPIKLGTELSAFLKRFTRPKIIVPSIMYNPYLNVKKLNNYIIRIVNCFDNCEFVDDSSNMHGNLTNLKNKTSCSIINHTIDKLDYDKYYIRRKFNETINQKNVNRESDLKPGTIPYYFNKINKKTGKLTAINPHGTEEKINTDKNKITYYFPVKKTSNKNNQIKEYSSTSSNAKETFFRS